ncbi:MAG: hypothetical protein IH586_05130 [Anaerolineaceae bacterium]|nr:hypothetical protein [Anaerolineaceae bacterium]
MKLNYVLLRIARHFMPASLARLFLRRGLIIRPGPETSAPQSAVDRYQAGLEELGCSFQGKRVLVLGYGGSFAVGCALLDRGAKHVVLCDPYAPPDHERNRLLLQTYAAYVSQVGNQVILNPRYFSLLEADIRQVAEQNTFQPVDIVVSSSVYEHLDDVEGITSALAQITRPDGLGLHFVDLRDHYFRYPFEMLRYSSKTWHDWFNPTSNLNRCRLWDYRQSFERYFKRVEIRILDRDDLAFEKARAKIRPEFLSGNLVEDAATVIRVTMGEPILATKK